MKVFIFALAHSGAPALISALTAALPEHDSSKPIVSMDPFGQLPGEPVPDGQASDSIPAITLPENTPQFLTSESVILEVQSQLESLLPSRNDDTPLIAVIDRSIGWFPAYLKAFPEARFVILLRNPVDVLNEQKSASGSYFSSDGFTGNKQSFFSELASFGEPIIDSERANPVQREAEFWFQANQFLLQAGAGNEQTLVVDYDSLGSQSGAELAQLWQFLGLRNPDEYESVSPLSEIDDTAEICLTKNEFESIQFYDSCYDDWQDQFQISAPDTRPNRETSYWKLLKDDLPNRVDLAEVQQSQPLSGSQSENGNGATRPNANSKMLAEMLRRSTRPTPPGGLKPAAARSAENRLHFITGSESAPPDLNELLNTRLYPRGMGARHYNVTGIAARCDWAIITDESKRDIVIHGDPEKPPRTIFLSMRLLHAAISYFCDEVLPGLTEPFVLVTGSEDITVPAQMDQRFRQFTARESSKINALLEDRRLIQWFAENKDTNHPKLSTLPVGYVYEPGVSFTGPIASPATPIDQRPLKALCGHRVRDSEQWQLRRQVSAFCESELSDLVTVLKQELPLAEFEKEMQEHPFVLCVEGGGLDPSPKAWMAIANGSIPVVRSSTLNDAYQDLPVAFVDDWAVEALSKAQFEAWLEELGEHYLDSAKRQAVLNKLTLEHWWQQIISRSGQSGNVQAAAGP